MLTRNPLNTQPRTRRATVQPQWSLRKPTLAENLRRHCYPKSEAIVNRHNSGEDEGVGSAIAQPTTLTSLNGLPGFPISAVCPTTPSWLSEANDRLAAVKVKDSALHPHQVNEKYSQVLHCRERSVPLSPAPHGV
ncbi:hypothetical protein G7046_g2040 [Stylonectria norvegica]|nr:hypothetical protein G7046_g2040 [Stylonectria norvegica]